MAQDRDAPEINRDMIVDRIYEIALEPSSLEEFIDFWHDTDLSEKFSDFDKSYKAHLERGETFLQRGEIARPDLMEYLQPYDNLAAFIVVGSLIVEASNSGAQSAFGVSSGDSLDQLNLPAEMRAALMRTTQDVLNRSEPSEKFLKTELATKGGAILFRIMRIAEALEDGPAALIVSTHFHWREKTGALLGSVFQLTGAEQNVVRLLIEGQDTKSIATTRNTSEGTVRGQIKSITGKMNLRSQKDIVRLVMALGEFPMGVAGKEAVDRAKPELSKNWLETEVWKPFKSISLPDGRALTYHDMGPPTGDPVLFSHMGSCMARWSRSMIHLAFERNLRVICPIRAGYGYSDNLAPSADPFEAARNDTMFLLERLCIPQLPYVVQGSDFPFAADLIAKQPDIVSELIGIGGRPCLPGGLNVDGAGRWQRFFVSTARNSPHLVRFASKAVMAMCKRIGPEAMLRQLCKDSPSDLALLEREEMKQILVANIRLMAGEATNAARAFAMEYIAFQEDWSDSVMATRHIRVQIFLAEEDPTINIGSIPKLQEAYPWIEFEVVPEAGLALIYQKPEKLIPLMADAAKRAILNVQ
ncbi:MAG: LuxR C-terminal-related transcriptional regulator [Alphaproteobacteria bacterium]|nr:LuxR C-terminal-related transcriptional regulator [Alphaproteobacteria bacterium]